MCGISGASNIDKAPSIVLDMIVNIQHRGKDATGLAYIKDSKINIIKKAIDPAKFKEQFYGALDNSKVCIGHNRQASTNVANKKLDTEAHPFIAEDGSFALCHNGTLSNHEYLAYLLDCFGHKRQSGVDSELFVHLLEELLSSYNKLEAIKHLYSLSEGNLLVLFNDGTIYGLAGGAMCILDIGNAKLIASEIKAFTNMLELVDRAEVALPDYNNGIVEIYNGSAKYYGEWSRKIVKEGSFVAKKETSCDFCSSRALCEQITIDNKQYDRCYKCYKDNKTTPTRTYNNSSYFNNRGAYRSSYVAYPLAYDYKQDYSYSKKKDSNMNIIGKCEICGSKGLLVICSKCGTKMCLECLEDHIILEGL